MLYGIFVDGFERRCNELEIAIAIEICGSGVIVPPMRQADFDRLKCFTVFGVNETNDGLSCSLGDGVAGIFLFFTSAAFEGIDSNCCGDVVFVSKMADERRHFDFCGGSH